MLFQVLLFHPIVPVARGAGRLVSMGGDGASLESMMHFEMDEVTDPAALDGIRSALERVLADVRAAVEDWRPTRDRLQATIAELGEGAPTVPSEEAAEAAEFLRSEEHTSELQSLMRISYAVFCLKKKNKKAQNT